MDSKNKKTLMIVIIMILAVIMIIVGCLVFFNGSRDQKKDSLSCTINNNDGYKVTSNTKFESGKVISVEMIYFPKEGEIIYDGKSKTAVQAIEYIKLQGTTYTSIDDVLHIFLEKRAYNANKNNTAVTNLFLSYDKLKSYYEGNGYICK